MTAESTGIELCALRLVFISEGFTFKGVKVVLQSFDELQRGPGGLHGQHVFVYTVLVRYECREQVVLDLFNRR